MFLDLSVCLVQPSSRRLDAHDGLGQGVPGNMAADVPKKTVQCARPWSRSPEPQPRHRLVAFLVLGLETLIPSKPEQPPVRQTEIVVYSTQRAPLPGLRRLMWRMILVCVVLSCFVLIQASAAEVLHNHSHSGAHTHCCPACHAGHLLVVPGTNVAVQAPSNSEWHTAADELPAAMRRTFCAGSSRAPPA
jgi:hypothetical protein